jgi:hypothetical protein
MYVPATDLKYLIVMCSIKPFQVCPMVFVYYFTLLLCDCCHYEYVNMTPETYNYITM